MARPSAATAREQVSREFEDSSSDESDETENARCLKFRQQELWAIKPVWSPRCVVIMYYIVAAIFIPIGVAVLVSSLRMMQTDHVRYDNRPACDVGAQSSSERRSCVVSIKVTKDTSAPSYLYYGLTNYYQNSRNYITSRSFEQLRGKPNPDLHECEDGGAAVKNSVPCGLTAISRFNDTFELCRDKECKDKLDVRKKGIAWAVDVKKRFRPGPVGKYGYTNESNNIVTDQDFMVWMRLSPYQNFHKLYRIIREDLKQGTYYIRVNASYPVKSFGGEKFIFISETSWFGGRSTFLAISYLVVGGIGLVMATIFAVCAGTAREQPLPPETSIPTQGYAHDSNNGLSDSPGTVEDGAALEPSDGVRSVHRHADLPTRDDVQSSHMKGHRYRKT